MSKGNTEEKVRAILVDLLGIDEGEVTREASIVDDLGCDSLDQVEVIMACEEEWGIEITDEDAAKATRVGDMIDYIDRRLAAAKAPAP